jgi:hypothetical protein
MQSKDVPDKYHFKGFEKFLAFFGITFLTLFALYYLYVNNFK